MYASRLAHPSTSASMSATAPLRKEPGSSEGGCSFGESSLATGWRAPESAPHASVERPVVVLREEAAGKAASEKGGLALECLALARGGVPWLELAHWVVADRVDLLSGSDPLLHREPLPERVKRG